MRSSLQLLVRGWARVAPRPRPGVQVLAYHRVGVAGDALSVRSSTFARQMAQVASERSTRPVLPLDELLASFDGGTMSGHALAITFDDAWADIHGAALEILRRHDLPATVYVPSRLLGSGGYLSRTQLDEMIAGGCRVGAHTRTHPDLRMLSDRELADEIGGSKADLEDALGFAVTSFAYPAGLFDDRVVRAVERAGFASAVTTRRGWLTAKTPRMRIPRAFVEEFSDSTFRAATHGGLRALAPLDQLSGRFSRPIESDETSRAVLD